MKGEQLALSVALSETKSFGAYHPGPNTAAVDTLKDLLSPGAGLCLLLHGPSGSGKSHLAHALCAAAKAQGLSAQVLSLQDAALPAPEQLDQYSKHKLIAIDGLDHQALPEAFSLALLRLLDSLKSRSANLLLTARKGPAQLEFIRPDLTTRVAAAASFGLKPLSDTDRARLLTLNAHERGLHLPEDVAHYLLRHLPRDVASLLDAIESLDNASLAQQRRLTIPFVQSVLLRA